MRLAYYCIAFSDQRWDVTATYVAYRELSRVSTLKWPGATIIAPETSWSLTSSHTHISRCSNDFSKAEILQGNFELCEITINSPYFAYQQTACESYFMHSYIQFSVLSNSYMPLNYRAYNHFMFTIRDNNYMHALMPPCCVKCRHEFFCTLMNTAGSDRKRKCYLAYGDMTRSCISTKDRWLLGFLHVAANVVL